MERTRKVLYRAKRIRISKILFFNIVSDDLLEGMLMPLGENPNNYDRCCTLTVELSIVYIARKMS